MSRWPAVLIVAALVAAAGCRPSRAATSAPAGQPRVTVAASVFPLAELARRIGLNRVTVTEVSTAGAGLVQAQLVLLVGGGFQPPLERAVAARQGVVIMVGQSLGRDPHFWLDPVAMQRASGLVAGALAQADPAGAAAYRAAATSFNAQLGALDIDYHSSLAGCLRRDLVTADRAFAGLAARYGLVGHTTDEPGIVALVRARDVRTVFTEAPRPSGTAEALANATGIKTVPLDPLETRTPEEVARGAGYLALMTDNLAKIRTALACSGSSP